MQLLITHKLEDGLVLPLNYHHILQAIIYSCLENHTVRYNDFLHNEGFARGSRTYKLFTFSLLKGRYEIANKKITFFDEVSFEVRSPDVFMIKLLAQKVDQNGIHYGDHYVAHVNTILLDETVEENVVLVKMMTPICVYSTDPDTKKTYFYHPTDQGFGELINENFIRKYAACYGIEPESDVEIEPVSVTEKDKFVTNYKGFYLSGWQGIYCLYGERKYLDFLYQTGLGSRNSQGFGMFRLL